MPLTRHRRLSFAVLLTITCGGRTELDVPPPLPPAPECDLDSDCPGSDNACTPTQCVDTAAYEGELPELPAGIPLPPRVCIALEAIDCDDNDPCTADLCATDTGECEYGPATLDLDGDGHSAPLPGTVPGELGACGDDCNDASAAAFPGAIETCDGVDNDCNGIVDDGAAFIPIQVEPVRVSSAAVTPASPGGLAYSGDSFLSLYSGENNGFDMYATRIDTLGGIIEPSEQQVAVKNADSSGGPIVWIGDRYGLAWQDRRFGNYEIFFALLAPDGTKATSDVRLSDGFDFSVNPSITWNGNDFYVAWQDRRDGLFDVFARRVDVYGTPVGPETRLTTPGGFNDEAPSLASGPTTLGLAFANGEAGYQRIRFKTYDYETLQPVTETVVLTNGETEAVYPTVVWNEDRYLIAWFDRSAVPQAVYAATVDEQGNILTPATAITSPGASHSRYPSLLPLGDRALVVYSDDRDNNQGYELYSRMITSDLAPLTEELRVTNATFDSVVPITAFGPEGNVGILFRDDRDEGFHHVWFTQLGCVTPP